LRKRLLTIWQQHLCLDGKVSNNPKPNQGQRRKYQPVASGEATTMNYDLAKILHHIDQRHKDNISKNSRFYMEVDIGKEAEALGLSGLKEKYRKINAIVPLKHPVSGMKVRIDGRTFVDYAQYESGLALPGYVARDAGLPYDTYRPSDSMILNFC
jgi:hypothetical protein